MSEKQPQSARANAPAPDAAGTGVLPGRLTAAAVLTGLQGLVVAGLGVYMLVTGIVGDPESVQMAMTGGATLLALAAVPLVAARGLRLGRRWSRGPALITQLMALPVAWTLFGSGGLMAVGGAALALSAVAVAALLLNPKTTEALGIGVSAP
ncbi:hypothetical protein AB0D54_10385 [Streptomyces xanthophaeus]|uniref:hypothetical protein n=1 Tax=Streptomyces xanthophaeus TaxID=67385 RepID=UPI003442A35F